MIRGIRTYRQAAAIAVIAVASFTTGPASAAKTSTVVLVVDLSQLMRAYDVAPTRFEATRSAMAALLSQIPARVRVGLVAFSSQAHVLQVPTTNRSTIANKLQGLKQEVGNGLGTGLQAAVDLAGRYRPAIIIVAAGGLRDSGPSAVAAANRAKALGILIYGVAVGSREGKVSYSFPGGPTNSIPTPTDPGSIRKVARITGGEAFVATNLARLQSAFAQLGVIVAR